MNFYETYTAEQLINMGKVYYSGKANKFQAEKYEAIRAGLLAELRAINPAAQDSGSAEYIRGAIESAIREKNKHEKQLNDQARANMQTAHNQLKNYK
jgi:hypothetical protein